MIFNKNKKIKSLEKRVDDLQRLNIKLRDYKDDANSLLEFYLPEKYKKITTIDFGRWPNELCPFDYRYYIDVHTIINDIKRLAQLKSDLNTIKNEQKGEK